MKARISVFVLFVVLSLNISALAHHSIPVFWNQEKKIQITGVLKSATIVNPHSVFVIEVTDANGQKADWTGITAAGTAMMKAGWTADTIKAGTKVIVKGSAPRKEGTKGILIESFTLPDGKTIEPAKID
jgi:uncharacterized protein DUF6152